MSKKIKIVSAEPQSLPMNQHQVFFLGLNDSQKVFNMFGHDKNYHMFILGDIFLTARELKSKRAIKKRIREIPGIKGIEDQFLTLNWDDLEVFPTQHYAKDYLDKFSPAGFTAQSHSLLIFDRPLTYKLTNEKTSETVQLYLMRFSTKDAKIKNPYKALLNIFENYDFKKIPGYDPNWYENIQMYIADSKED